MRSVASSKRCQICTLCSSCGPVWVWPKTEMRALLLAGAAFGQPLQFAFTSAYTEYGGVPVRNRIPDTASWADFSLNLSKFLLKFCIQFSIFQHFSKSTKFCKIQENFPQKFAEFCKISENIQNFAKII